MNSYKAVVKESVKGLTAREKIAIKALNDVTELNDLVTPEQAIMINIDNVVTVQVHNEKSDNQDYNKYVYIDKDGTKYVSGSEPLYTTVKDILSDIEDAIADGEMDETEDITIKVMKKESANYKGQMFLTAELI
ncbi:hypothetical protein [Parabacteroides johnsonii]|uniref:hypothetical protein n=1 Tax=Parabacteroides johnsonii TaxID=387661 RepID=UPI00242F0875|nr:hypothetical protein [Parabacteroides johnsonii]MBS6225797.1 hypothetical protein [Parabacteroides johnsonii]